MIKYIYNIQENKIELKINKWVAKIMRKFVRSVLT